MSNFNTGDLTFSILKPDITKRNLTGRVNSVIESSGFKIVAQRMLILPSAVARGFYKEHAEKDFFLPLIEFMTSAPVVLQVLQASDAVLRYRTLMGATDPSKAQEGTIRKEFALSMRENSVHGSDSVESAASEIAFFFCASEIYI